MKRKNGDTHEEDMEKERSERTRKKLMADRKIGFVIMQLADKEKYIYHPACISKSDYSAVVKAPESGRISVPGLDRRQ
jgi:hypothetical protein